MTAPSAPYTDLDTPDLLLQALLVRMRGVKTAMLRSPITSVAVGLRGGSRSRSKWGSSVFPYVRAMSATDSTTSPDSIYRFNVRDANGQEVPMSIFNDKKVLLIVNVASQCGFTPQYRELQTLQDKYGDKGFSVVAFPCNQFGGQEPGTVSEVCSFAKDRFKVSFPIMDKVEVNGKNADPLWQYLKEKQPGFITNAIKWNFSKFMVKDGIPTKRYSPHESPASIEPDIDAALSTDVNA